MAVLHKAQIWVICTVLIAPITAQAGQDLVRYRSFELGTDVASIMKQTRSEASSLRTLYTTPELIQTLQWNQDYLRGPSPGGKDPVRAIRFDFYDDRLVRIVARYDNRLLEGLTVADMIEVISQTYGTPSKPGKTVVVVSSIGSYIEEQKVLASWTNGEYSYSLFRSSLGGEFGLVASSDRLELLAAESVREARQLETDTAPQREQDRLANEAETRQAAEEKAKSLNKPNFRP